MSGIEVAGLVLGAFPILIHALDRYREGAEVLMDWWRIQRAYKKCRQDLSYHQLLFEGNIERFLLPLVVDDDEMKALMADPAGDGWEDKELETRLQERLPKSYNLFLDIMANINELMETLKKELGINNIDFQATLSDDGRLMRSGGARKDLLSMANMEFQAKRIKFSLKKSSRDRLFGQLQEANERMRNLLESSDHITAARRSREATKPTSIMNRKINEFWQHAKRLHEALSKAWQCGCGSHVANLQLQHRTSDKVEFDVLFNVGATTGHNHWRETKIKMLPGIFTTPLGGVSISTGQQATPTTTRSPRQVRWTAPSSQPPPKASNEQMVKIHDLCSALSTHYPDCFGFLDEDEHRFAFYPGSQTVSISNISTITLDRLLEDTYALSRRKRYFLALTLASSYLQLGSTPWLSAPLRNDSIVFLQDPSDPSSIILDQPYIRREISKHPCTPTPDTISILGIRLLELCFGATLENNRFRKQLPTGDAVSGPVLDYAAAIQWSKLVSEEAGPEFAEAIDWCLHAKELNDGSWRKEIWTHVIIPLDSCHKQVSQKPLLR